MDEAVTDGNFVTAPAWPAQGAWIAQLVALLGTRVEHATRWPSGDLTGDPQRLIQPQALA
jgi:hypothetical protein